MKHVYYSRIIKALVYGALFLGSYAVYASAARQPAALVLAKNGVALMKIILNSTNAIPAEKTAARELTTYLEKITGAKFEVLNEKDLPDGKAAIFLGDTQYAKDQGIDISKLGVEESVLKTIGGNLIIAGGRPRGTLYAVYIFLEDVLGCRWYTPWCEKAPAQRTCTVPDMDRRTSPRLKLRDMATGMDPSAFKEQWKWFVVRNRLNGKDIGGGRWKIQQPYDDDYAWSPVALKEGEEVGGGWLIFGPGNHSFNFFIPAKKYFKDHPEYFSMRDGKRVPGGSNEGNHLCLTNPEVLQLMIEKVKKAFRKEPASNLISVSINDGGSKTICDCPECRKVANEEGESGLLLQFVNAVADAIKDEFPDKYILTLAYNPTAAPPKRIVARDNVIIYNCSAFWSGAVFESEPTIKRKFNSLSAWAKYAKHIWCWDYLTCWNAPISYFHPILWKLDEQFKSLKEFPAIDGMFQEGELMLVPPVPDEQYEMRMWISAKLMEDPSKNVDLLIEDFINGYYGKAEKYLTKYMEMVKERLHEWPYRLVDYEFIKKTEGYFDKAENIIKDEPEYLMRVKEWRISIDLTALSFRHQLVREYLKQGGKLENYPYSISILKDRILTTLEKTTHPYLVSKQHSCWRVPPYPWGITRDQARDYVKIICGKGKEYAPLPDELQDIPSDRIIDIVPTLFWGYGDLVEDPEAALGLAIVRKNADELPMPIAYWDAVKQKQTMHRDLNKEDIPDKGYHLYYGGKFTLSENGYVFLTKSWQIQFLTYMLYNSEKPNQEWKVWASMKFTGPAYPHGNTNEPNGVFFDRVIFVKEGESGVVKTETEGNK